LTCSFSGGCLALGGNFSFVLLFCRVLGSQDFRAVKQSFDWSSSSISLA
jgi:hypothetical protein